MYISPYCRLALVPPIFMKFGIRGQLTDVIMCVKLLLNRFRGYGVLTPPKLPFPIDLLRRPYDSVALPCDTLMKVSDVHWPSWLVCVYVAGYVAACSASLFICWWRVIMNLWSWYSFSWAVQASPLVITCIAFCLVTKPGSVCPHT